VLHDCVAAAIRREGSLLLCRRGEHREWYPGVWDLPGGHIEAGEAPQGALVRELREELGIDIDPPSRPADAIVADVELSTAIWLVDRWESEVRNLAPAEHDAVEWFNLAELSELSLAHRDYLGLFASLVFARDQPTS
jgi:mutator protein MutT